MASAAALALLLHGVPASADDDGDGPPDADPGVARISVAQGDVAVRRADSGDTYAAVVNAPVAAGDYLSTQDDSRGEVEFDFGASLRVAPDTQLRFTDLRPRAHQVQLAQGTVDLRVFRGLAAHPEVQTPAATIRPAGDGSFRITVTDDGDTEVTARAGRVNVETAAGTQTLEPGPSLLIAGDPANPQVRTIDPVPADGFDAFNRRRDAYVERADDWAYVDAGFVGSDDLDAYGTWTEVAGYGRVWQPNDEPDGWAPYHTGRWVWEPYYGWSWVDDAPWGYAPYHYGRWFYADATWYWSPGISVAGPVAYSAPVVFSPQPVVYRPALVAFFSFGGGVSASLAFGGGAFGFGNIGWCPLAPSEPFHPWYGRGVTDVNVTNVTEVNVNVVRAYRNLSAPGGAVAVNNGNFANGDFRHVTTLTRAQLATVAPVRGVVPVVPTASNLSFGGRAAPAPAPVSGRFASFRSRPKTTVAPFATQQRTVQSAAVKTYPEHAAVFTHPEVQQKFDRPGLITNENVPDEFKPNATVRTDGEPAVARPAIPSKPETTGTADPFSRFDRSPNPDRTTAPRVLATGTPARPDGGVSPSRPDAAPTYRSNGTPAYAPYGRPTPQPYAVPGDRPNGDATPRPYVAPNARAYPTPAAAHTPYVAPPTYRPLPRPTPKPHPQNTSSPKP